MGNVFDHLKISSKNYMGEVFCIFPYPFVMLLTQILIIFSFSCQHNSAQQSNKKKAQWYISNGPFVQLRYFITFHQLVPADLLPGPVLLLEELELEPPESLEQVAVPALLSSDNQQGL